MERLKIKFSTEVVNFEIEAEKIENGDKDFLAKIVGMFNEKTSVTCSHTEQYITKELQNENHLTTGVTSESKVENEDKNNPETVEETTEEAAEEKAEETTEEKDEHNCAIDGQAEHNCEHNFPHSIDLLGVKVRKDKTYGYQTYYICPMCKYKGKRFAGQLDKFVYCHQCNFRMSKMDASTGFPEKDSYGNYFVAGDFIPVGLDFKS
ncbi:hypothetical protein [Bacillus cereus]|uniref:hypothetical protein n=1 Tax=Bacillus cereus TaxID=1396 RepID=UPI000B4B8590|nr:hypothetical protein [Bacillus cereus]